MAYVHPDAENISLTLGPFIIGVSVSCVFTGMILTQAYSYFERYQDDPMFLKLAAGVVALFNVAGTFVGVWMVWSIGITNFGNYKGLAEQPQGIAVGNLLAAVVGLICQSWFAFRTWRSWDRSPYLAGTFAFLITATLVGSLGGPITHIIGALHIVKPFGLTWLFGAAAGDVLISGLLMIKLVQSRKEDELPKNTLQVIDSLLVLVLSTATATTVLALTDAILVGFVDAGNNVHSAFTVCVPRLYACCFFFTLNARHKLRHGLHQSGSTRPTTDPPSWSPRRTPPKAPIVVTRTELMLITSNDQATTDLESVADRRPAVRHQDYESTSPMQMRKVLPSSPVSPNRSLPNDDTFGAQ